MQIMNVKRAERRRAGMTLIELLAVLVILGILIGFLVPKLAGLGAAAEEKVAKTQLTQIDLAIAQYELEFGDYPQSRYDAEWGPAPNELNLGGECLVQRLWGKNWAGTDLSMDELGNVDGDLCKKDVTRDLGKQLFELLDPWENPIAYFHRKDYGRVDMYVTNDPETGEPLESTVQARKDPRTKGFAKPQKYQLISAGPNGLFGDEDDIVNFKVK